MVDMAKHVFWIVDILCDRETEEKIARDHGVTYEMACEAVRLGSYETATWREGTGASDERRLFVVGKTRGGTRLLVILHPVDIKDGRWALGSAWELK